MDALAVMRAVIAGLPPDTAAALKNVTFELHDKFLDVDRLRGALPEQRGYFYGIAPEPSRGGTELPDDTPASGVIVVFGWNHTSDLEVERTARHEIAHALGHSEEEISAEMGLGC
jgi:hypothetical protein